MNTKIDNLSNELGADLAAIRLAVGKLTGDADKEQKTCPDNTFVCYESCCTNAEECCTTTQGCTAVGDCAPPSPQSIKQFQEHQR